MKGTKKVFSLHTFGKAELNTILMGNLAASERWLIATRNIEKM